MYRCRILALILSLAIVASFFVFSASAENPPFFEIRVSYTQNGTDWSTPTWRTLTEGALTTFNNANVGWRIDAVRCFTGSATNTTFWVGFQICQLLNSASVGGSYTASKTVTGNATNSNSTNWWAFWTLGNNHIENITYPGFDNFSYSLNSGTFYCRFEIHSDEPADISIFTFTSPIEIKGNANMTLGSVPVIYNCTFLDDYSFLLNSKFDSLDARLVAINGLLGVNNTYTNNINNRLESLWTNTYYWHQVEYDPLTEQLTTRQESGSFWNALLGSIQSISADAEAQAAAQEKANSKGAGDALDDAYDGVGSSFGKLSDFSDLSDMASWNGGSFSDQAEGGILSWFSQACRDDIDAVPRSREPLDIIDVYSGHIAEYYAALGEDDGD